MNLNPIDVYVGLRLKMRRSFLGISQHKIGELTGITFQQVQKYERGTNRIGSSRLYELSKILMVPISYFFDGLEEKSLCTSILNDNSEKYLYSDNNLDSTNSNVGEKEILQLIKFYTRIKDETTRKSVLNLAKSLSKKEEND